MARAPTVIEDEKLEEAISELSASDYSFTLTGTQVNTVSGWSLTAFAILVEYI